MQNQIKIDSEEGLSSILEILRVIIKEGTQQQPNYSGGPLQRRGAETDETIEEQGQLARIVHLLRAPKNDTQYKLLQVAQKAFAEGGERIKHTYPPLITAALKLARSYKHREHFEDNWSSQCQQVYKFIHSMLSALYSRVNGFNDAALRLYVSCGSVADQTGHEEVAYEFFAQAFTVYEEAISDSRAQFQAVCVVASALHGTRGFGKENYDTLITKCALHGSKLLKKPDQCRAVYLASHLWWAVPDAKLGEEDATNVSVSQFLVKPVLMVTAAIPRWQEGARMLAKGTSGCGCLHGHCRVCRAIRRDFEPIRVLL